MPWIVPSHQAPVLPLKAWRPAWFSGLGLVLGSVTPDLVFIFSLGFYVTPAVLGGGKVIMVSNQIANDIELFYNWGAASSLGVVLLALTLLFLYLASRFAKVDQMIGGGHGK